MYNRFNNKEIFKQDTKKLLILSNKHYLSYYCDYKVMNTYALMLEHSFLNIMYVLSDFYKLHE